MFANTLFYFSSFYLYLALTLPDKENKIEDVTGDKY
jgi:hypothetical protein